MQGHSSRDISKFFIAGINYKKSDAEVRGQFAINPDQYARLLLLAPAYGVNELFILSTCNRTEIYGVADQPSHLIRLLCTQTEGSENTFQRLAYIKKGYDAAEHLFRVAAGLDSQILGDYEIVGQIKQAVKYSRENGFTSAFMDRLVNNVLQSSKAIKNQTELSGGTVSVSFAAVQYIREKLSDVANKKILLLGVGKIGRNTCKNLVDYLDTQNITLINRTEEKAAMLANELNLSFTPIEQLAEQVRQSDIILVATNSAEPTIEKIHLEGSGDKLIIDLSIPYNVAAEARELSNVHLVNVDDLSKLKDATLRKRKAEVPKAKAIIREHITEFMEWFEMRKHAPVLRSIKSKLQEIPTTSTANTDKKIQRVINGMASKMRVQNQRGCQYIEAINEYLATGSD